MNDAYRRPLPGALMQYTSRRHLLRTLMQCACRRLLSGAPMHYACRRPLLGALIRYVCWKPLLGVLWYFCPDRNFWFNKMHFSPTKCNLVRQSAIYSKKVQFSLKFRIFSLKFLVQQNIFLSPTKYNLQPWALSPKGHFHPRGTLTLVDRKK
jgi:hypothetical protein